MAGQDPRRGPAPLRTTHEHDGWFVVRTPLLPINVLLGLERDGDDPADEPARAARRRTRLRALLDRAEFSEALFVASPSLVQSLDDWRADPASRSGRKSEKSVLRYLSRMCGRATPFGLFAGVALGLITDGTGIRLSPHDAWRRRTRIDDWMMVRLADALTQRPEARNSVKFEPNSTVYAAGGRLRYVESVIDNEQPRHELVAIQDSAPLRVALDSARTGATRPTIAAALVSSGMQPPDASAFVDDLIAARILVSELEPTVTGPDALTRLIGLCAAAPELAGLAERLRTAKETLHALDAMPLGVSASAYRSLEKQLEELVPMGRYVTQVDLAVDARATLAHALVSEALEAVDLLRPLQLVRIQELKELEDFRNRFVARYEMREMPLAEVLDEELGIGFGPRAAQTEGGELLEDVPVHESGAPAAPAPVHALQLAVLEKALRNRALEVEITADDIKRVTRAERLPDYPASFSLHCAIAGCRPPNTGHRVVLLGIDGGSGARMLGRMCETLVGLEERVRNLLRREESEKPAAVFAEIIHCPQGRVGNVVHRPRLRDYEIPWAGRSSVHYNYQIPISDLTVAVRDDRILLRSRRLGKEVIPRLTSAHAYTWSGNLVPYRFLGSLQSQDSELPGGVWAWGALDSARFLPRVVIGRVVLSSATWTLTPGETDELHRASDSSARRRVVQAWRQSLGLPRMVRVGTGDQVLPIDLDSAFGVDLMADGVPKGSALRLREMYPGPDELIAEGPGGRFVHELIVPVVRKAAAGTQEGVSSPLRTPERLHPESRRAVFPPGKEWLFVKLYAGSGAIDPLLHRLVPSIFRSADYVDRWFFIRYGDPEWHVRLRFHGPPQLLVSDLLPRISGPVEALMREGWMWRMTLDTYEPELERYGGVQGMELAEAFFHADSDFVLNLLGVAGGSIHSDDRWRLVFRSIADLLRDLGIPLAQRRLLFEKAMMSFGKEFPNLSEAKPVRARKLRAIRPVIDRIVAGGSGLTEGDPEEDACFARRTARIASLGERLRALFESNALSCDQGDYVMSLVHMAANRLLRWAHRPQEMLVYDFLAKAYESALARQKVEQARAQGESLALS